MRPSASHLELAGAGVLLALGASLGTAAAAVAQTDTARRDIPPVPVTKERRAPSSGIPVGKTPRAGLPDTTVSRGEVTPKRDSTPPRGEQTTPTPLPVAAPVAAPVVPQPTTSLRPFLFGESGLFLGVAAGGSVPTGTLNDVRRRRGGRPRVGPRPGVAVRRVALGARLHQRHGNPVGQQRAALGARGPRLLGPLTARRRLRCARWREGPRDARCCGA